MASKFQVKVGGAVGGMFAPPQATTNESGDSKKEALNVSKLRADVEDLKRTVSALKTEIATVRAELAQVKAASSSSMKVRVKAMMDDSGLAGII